MIVYDESAYEDGEKHAEDIEGYQFCYHCKYCPVPNENEIYTDGGFYCYAQKRWKLGIDCLEFRCKDYEVRSCSSCKRQKTCANASEGRFCENYWLIEVQKRTGHFFGRRKIGATNDGIIRAEAKYNELRAERINNQVCRGDEDREHQKREEGDGSVGYLQVSNSYKKNKVYLPLKEAY